MGQGHWELIQGKRKEWCFCQGRVWEWCCRKHFFIQQEYCPLFRLFLSNSLHGMPVIVLFFLVLWCGTYWSRLWATLPLVLTHHHVFWQVGCVRCRPLCMSAAGSTHQGRPRRVYQAARSHMALHTQGHTELQALREFCWWECRFLRNLGSFGLQQPLHESPMQLPDKQMSLLSYPTHNKKQCFF